MFSKKQPMPSTGDDSEPTTGPGPAPLLTAVQLLAGRNVFGLVWIGTDLIVQSTYGRLVDFVAIGENVTDSVYALVGFEDDIRSLQTRSGDVLDLPEVTLVRPEGRRPRANLSVYWSEADRAFILLVARTGSRSELEIELVGQMRARLMAEAELAAKTRRLEEVNGELARANADLEAYASIVSHDLQSPMRALRYMIDDLEAALGQAPCDDVGGRLEALRAQSRRMTGMLSALLDYASVTRKSDAIAPVDTGRMIHDIVGSVHIPPGFRVLIEGTWPTFDTAAAPLDLVLRNLVENAVKHHDREAGTLRLTARVEDSAVVFDVADDGPGIRLEHRDAVFLPFRKLSPERGTTGEGMGLALVRRAVEGLGGRIGVSSPAPDGRGTHFMVRWPR
jgi:signal transduction histidine kinase